MFVHLNAPMPELRPADSGISENDWRILARSWHPVAVAGDIQDAPVKGRLLDVELVIYRTGEQVSVALDLCPHRNIRLSAGTIEDGAIVCPFHGLAFDGAGQCVKVPALGRAAKLPPSYRLHSFRSEVRYGLVWACLDDESTLDIPNMARADEVGTEYLAFSIPRDWPIGAPHQIENYIDMAHLPFVHRATLGGDREDAVPMPRITHGNDTMTIVADFRHTWDGGETVFTYHNTVHLPFCVYTDALSSKEYEEGDPMGAYQMWDIAAPISAHECRVFSVFPMWEPQSGRSAPSPYDGDLINSEDIVVLKEMVRQDYPLEDKRQIHLPVDNISREYRRRLRDMGLGQG